MSHAELLKYAEIDVNIAGLKKSLRVENTKAGDIELTYLNGFYTFRDAKSFERISGPMAREVAIVRLAELYKGIPSTDDFA